ncbi:MAG: hypothetical protein Q618_VCMC00003G0132 [Varibaculum cambriense DORA_20]|uniref:hypothetical protein n=1 Tax=Varibaculum cambriense TaxID=184870 RepID=UPI0003D616DB|nr:hypothetical protein [Varibaculum cambriense]ETI81830.1 MAG: hypothetical protein Q618_VCMC00003G0132 [Varibaculum cambriense DORA_20]
MKTKTTKRILAALVTIPIAISLTGCGGTNDKKSEPKKPAVTSSQSVKDEKAAKEKAQAEAKAKAEADAKAQAQATPAPQKPAVKQVQKPAVQQTRKAAPSRSVAKKPARQYRAPAKPAAKKPAPQKPANSNSGYKLKPYEKYFDKSDMDKDGNITGGGDEFGNTW